MSLSVVVASLLSVASVAAAPNVPYKTLRAVVIFNGAVFVGGAEMSVSHVATGHYQITFPVGTWNNAGQSCFYVPSVTVGATGPNGVAIAPQVSFSLPLDGSGQVDVVFAQDVGFSALFVSANC
jgi:hypothetical protein